MLQRRNQNLLKPGPPWCKKSRFFEIPFKSHEFHENLQVPNQPLQFFGECVHQNHETKVSRLVSSIIPFVPGAPQMIQVPIFTHTHTKKKGWMNTHIYIYIPTKNKQPFRLQPPNLWNYILPFPFPIPWEPAQPSDTEPIQCVKDCHSPPSAPRCDRPSSTASTACWSAQVAMFAAVQPPSTRTSELMPKSNKNSTMWA